MPELWPVPFLQERLHWQLQVDESQQESCRVAVCFKRHPIGDFAFSKKAHLV
jgi:hypothetical protein